MFELFFALTWYYMIGIIAFPVLFLLFVFNDEVSASLIFLGCSIVFMQYLGFIDLKGLYEITAVEKQVENDVVTIAKKLLTMMDINLEIEITKSSEHFVLINLYGPDNGIIIGKKGKTLNSFEFLLNTLVKGCKVEVDVEGFKEKRANTLRDLARKMAEKAIQTDKAVKLNPMPPRERKIIHEIINKYEELDTYSEGKDPKRYIVIRKKKVG